MKGPVTGRLLFGDPLAHLYTDVDLLVGPGDRDRAGLVLEDLGFRDFHRSVLAIYRPQQQRAWVSETGIVDLHGGLWGMPEHLTETAWRTIWAEREELDLHGRAVPIIGARARLFQLALHAAQRQSGAKAVADLHQGLVVASPEDWQSAADLATGFEATAVFAAGLRRIPDGVALLSTLTADTRPTPKSILLLTRRLARSVRDRATCRPSCPCPLAGTGRMVGSEPHRRVVARPDGRPVEGAASPAPGLRPVVARQVGVPQSLKGGGGR